MRCHEVDYKIIGDDLQFVEIELDQEETIIAEAGSMMYMEDDIVFEAKMGDGSNPDQGMFGKLFSAGKRYIAGESVFLTHFTSKGSGKRHVAFASNIPGKIIALDMSTINGNILCQKESFLCAALGTKLDIAFTKRLGAGFFGGEGFILERISGDGMLFLNAGGTIVEKQLNNENLRVDTGCIVAFEETIDYTIERAGGLKSMIFGGEGIFLTSLRGTGRVWLQSLPFSRLADNIIKNAKPPAGNDKN